MSIIAFVGLPGSGKSYGVVENVILKALQEGRHVVTNIPLRLGVVYTEFPKAKVTVIDDLESELGVQYRDEQGKDHCPGFKKLPPGAIVILDEVWRIWPSGLKADKIPQEAKEFLAEHRHLVGPDGKTTEIVLVVQDLAQCAAFAVRLVQKTYISRKHEELGMTNRYVVGIFAGAIKGLRGPAGRELGVIQGSYKESVWKFYQSHTKSESASVVGNEQAADQRGVAWRRPLVMVGLPLALFFLGFGGWYLVHYFRTLGGGMPEPQSEISNVAESSRPAGFAVSQHDHVPGLVVPAAAVAAAEPVPLGPVYSSTWRLAAVIETADGTGVAMISAGKRQRRIPFEDCGRDAIGEWECRLDGELVTSWSGREASNLAESLVAAPTRALGYDK